MSDYQLGQVVDGNNDARKEFDPSISAADQIQQCYDYCVSVGCKEFDVIDKDGNKFCYFTMAEGTWNSMKEDPSAGSFFMEVCRRLFYWGCQQ